MADLFRKQAGEYAGGRPSYPPNLFAFIASKTPQHHFAWDVATGNGQAAIHLARMYKEVVATDSSPEQLSLAPKLPNVRYVHTPPAISLEDLQRHVAPAASLDLVTVAQAVHWFHLPTLYDQVSRLLRPGRGVFAAWCYTDPRVDAAFDAVFHRLYNEVAAPFWAPQRRMVDDEYRSIDFPFDPVEGEEGTGPFEFSTEREMDLEAFLTYLRSWSAYQTAKAKGVELLSEEMVEDFRKAWGGEGKPVRLVRYPVFLRIGKVAMQQRRGMRGGGFESGSSRQFSHRSIISAPSENKRATSKSSGHSHRTSSNIAIHHSNQSCTNKKNLVDLPSFKPTRQRSLSCILNSRSHDVSTRSTPSDANNIAATSP